MIQDDVPSVTVTKDSTNAYGQTQSPCDSMSMHARLRVSGEGFSAPGDVRLKDNDTLAGQ
jgi:hypothetical protein